MITVVCWKWKPAQVYRSQFGAEHVNVLHRMVRRNLHLQHEFVCVTDDPEGIDPAVRIVPLWPEHIGLQTFVGPHNPCCYRRLRAFSAEAETLLGKRILSIDLDCVITGDITPLVDRPEDFVVWGDTARNTHYNGGLWLLRAGARTKVWETFDPKVSPLLTRRAGIVGSDQAWISYALGAGEAMWGRNDGVYSFRLHLADGRPLPENARIVMFHGQHDPWHPDVQARHPWIRQHYR